METVLLVIHLLLALALIATVLMQKSEGGALGMGGSGGGGASMGGLMTGRGAGNLLTRATAILATFFICTSLTLAIMSNNQRVGGSVLDAPVAIEAAPAVPAEPAEPSVPVAE